MATRRKGARSGGGCVPYPAWLPRVRPPRAPCGSNTGRAPPLRCAVGKRFGRNRKRRMVARLESAELALAEVSRSTQRRSRERADLEGALRGLRDDILAAAPASVFGRTRKNLEARRAMEMSAFGIRRFCAEGYEIMDDVYILRSEIRYDERASEWMAGALTWCVEARSGSAPSAGFQRALTRGAASAYLKCPDLLVGLAREMASEVFKALSARPPAEVG